MTKFLNKYIFRLFLCLLILGSIGILTPVSAAATLYLAATASSVPQGNIVTIYPTVNTGGAATNAYEVIITFPSSKLQPVSISTSGSICTLFTRQPSYTTTTAKFSCGLPTPGYKGPAGRIGAVSFKTLERGVATIVISSSSRVLKNDGLGTDILGSRLNLNITITDLPSSPVATPKIESSLGESKNWYSSDEVKFTWNKPSKITGFSYTFSMDKSKKAGKNDKGTKTLATFTNLKDGLHYFKLAARSSQGQWSGDAEFVLRIDKTPPKDLEIVPDPLGESHKLPLISFNAVDDTSGINHYEIKIDDGEFVRTTNPYQIESISSGEHTVSVRAYDKAVNYVEGAVIIQIAEVPLPKIIRPASGSFIPIGKQLEVSGTSVPNATVFVYLNNELVGETQADDSGNYEFFYNQLLLAGIFSVSTDTRNEGGIWSPRTDPVSFTVDAYAINVFGVVVPSTIMVIGLSFIFFLFILLLVALYKRCRSKGRRCDRGNGRITE